LPGTGGRAYFAHLIQVLPEELIYRAISEARAETHTTQVRSRGAYLTTILKWLAQERGYDRRRPDSCGINRA
jgi:hypothetical protein